MLSAHGEDLPAREARRLLRQLRDLNLSTSLKVAENQSVTVDGCLTLDSPVELGVSYRVREGASPAVLRLVQQNGDVMVRLDGESPKALLLGLVLDEDGRAASSAILARVDLDLCDARALEHFLRRLVRGLYAAA